MFGEQLNSSECGCGCTNAECAQWWLMTGVVDGASVCADMENARGWVNDTSNYTARLPGWMSKPLCWSFGCTATFSAPGSGSPATPVCGGGSVEPSGFYWAAESYYTPVGAVELSIFLLGDSTAYIIGNWCQDGSVTGWMNTCVMTGTPVGSCYQYLIPVPAASLCSNDCGGDLGPTEAIYSVVPVSDPGNCFGGTWAELQTFCTANPTAPDCQGINFSPSSCLSPDPFYGDDPP